MTFSKILIANRGEIAVRIIQTCRSMGIGTVAIYSTPDRASLHVQMADEAYHVGPGPALESYLNVEAVLNAATLSGADAIHPGYGFFAENAGFARAVKAAGRAWIGPPPEVIALMGDKVAAKALAGSVGVSVVPGYFGEDQSPARMQEEAGRIGFPIMVKAVAGGGGKGMRSVFRAEDLLDALEGARREARSAFADERVFLEKLLLHPRHVEIQILADEHGNAIHLGERECSVQRRHQKVMEEAPSPIITSDLRVAMAEHALRLVRASGYTNAGTVEFLFSGDAYYFLEMNTRLQVEHPVTEEVTGLDLVRLQIEIAAGASLPVRQLDVHFRGHSVEARLYAEDADHEFLPATGRLQVFEPPEGLGIRNDIGVFAGWDIPPHYDPLLAKLVVHAETREQAVNRLRDALARYHALGVTTNLGFLHWLAGHEAFRRGRIDIGFIEHHWRPEQSSAAPPEVLMAAAAWDLSRMSLSADWSASDRHGDGYDPWRHLGAWRQSGAERSFVYRYGGRENRVAASAGADRIWHMSIGEAARDVSVQAGGPSMLVLREGPAVLEFTVLEDAGRLSVGWQGRSYTLGRPTLDGNTVSTSSGGGGQAGLAAPIPGTVVKVAVRPGQHVDQHEPLVILEAMKMEHVIAAPYAGIVKDVLFREGDLVPEGATVVRLDTA